MPNDGSGFVSGLLGNKGLKASDVKLCIINKYDREMFFQNLTNYGWEEVEDAFEFERSWSEKKIRKAAREHAADVNANLLVEVRDNDYSTNPFNDYVYYVYRSTPQTRGLPPPPQITPPGMMNPQMQMLADQQRALMQQQQMLQRMQVQFQGPQAPPPTPPGVPPGQVCARCGGNQIQYMANGMAKCIKCGFMFNWQQPQQQPIPQQQIPNVSPPVQPGAPIPPGTRVCPKCGNALNVFPDGSALCSKCGFTGK